MTQPPPTLPYAMPGATATTSYTPTDGFARWTITLLWINVILCCLGIGSAYMQATLLQRASAGDEIGIAEADSNDRREMVIGLLQLTIYIPTFVVFLIWLHRTYRNLKPLGTWKTDYSPGWAVGYWFIPILNLFRPYQVMKEIWVKSDPQRAGALASTQAPSILGWWWAAWLIGNFVDQAITRASLRAEEIPALLGLTYAGMFSGGLSIIAAVLLVRIIKRITSDQQAKYQSAALQPAVTAPTGMSDTSQLPPPPLNSL